MNVTATTSLAGKNTLRIRRALVLAVLCCVPIIAFAVSASSGETSSEFRPPTFPSESAEVAPDDPDQAEPLRQWRVFLDNIESGAGREAIEKLLAGNYRDKCTIALGGSGSNMDVYLLDDFYELRFRFDVIKGLTSKGIYKKTLWLRYPDGQVRQIEKDR